MALKSRVGVGFENLDQVTSNVYKYPTKFNKHVNNALNTQGVPIVRNNIIRHLPTSTGRTRKTKMHAKQGNSVRKMALKNKSKTQKGFYMTFYKPYYYVQFPDAGTKYQKAQHFLSRGARDSVRPIQQLVNNAIKNSGEF